MNDISPLIRANNAQREASDPAVSAFVSASAGSGKTKLLTDRLLRLMLADVHPGRILCLTYTRAAAAEICSVPAVDAAGGRRAGCVCAVPLRATDRWLRRVCMCSCVWRRMKLSRLLARAIRLMHKFGGQQVVHVPCSCQTVPVPLMAAIVEA